jgi:quercetin dioxygenase-like cupin family protein
LKYGSINNMISTRIFDSSAFIRPSTDEPIRSVVTESDDSVVVMWYVLPGQRIHPHVHPAGQDTWIVLSGQADYILDDTESTHPILQGNIVVARAGQAHGAINHSLVPFLFISIVSPASAGYHLLE